MVTIVLESNDDYCELTGKSCFKEECSDFGTGRCYYLIKNRDLKKENNNNDR